jgi:pyruvate/2-oxoglutarate dehydrogenase complex dihydrolipoamide dehydrogenase (E3) component
MANVEEYELLVLGGGKAGKTLAMDMAHAGRRVAVIERGLIGGSCINIACIPTKALVRSASVARLVRDRAMFGMGAGDVELHMLEVAARTAGVVEGMVNDHRRLFAESGFELVIGEGRFVAPRVIEVSLPDGGTRRLTGERIFCGRRAGAVPRGRHRRPNRHARHPGDRTFGGSGNASPLAERQRTDA